MLNKKETNPTNVGDVEVFNFSRENLPLRSRLIDGEPWFLAKDVAAALGYSNHRKAILDHCKGKGVTICDTLTDGGIQKTKYINEGNLYRLIVNCTLPIAEVFEEWIFDEVLPSIRRKGYYGVRKNPADYIDARDIPYARAIMNGVEIKTVEIEGRRWFSVNDVNRSMGSCTESSQSVRNLNARQLLARKIWLYGVTNPGWFTTELGVRLLLCSGQKSSAYRQLSLDFGGEEARP